MTDEQQAPERGWEAHAIAVVKQFYDEWWDNDRRRCLDAIIKRLTPLSSDLAPVAQPPKWDKSGLKEACQRALKLGRTHQETDIQLFLDMLLEIERLESALTSAQQRGSELQREVDAKILDARTRYCRSAADGNLAAETWLDRAHECEDNAAAIRAAKQQ